MFPDNNSSSAYGYTFPQLENLLNNLNGSDVTFEYIDQIIKSLVDDTAEVPQLPTSPIVEESEDLVNTLKDLIDSKSSKD